MKSSKIVWTLSALLLCGGLSLASGCGNRNTDNGNATNQSGIRQNALSPQGNVPPGGYKATPDDQNRIPALDTNQHTGRINESQLVRIAEQVPGVGEAVVAMNSTDVLVGIELDQYGNRPVVEKRVASALQWQYPEYQYHVTSDEELLMKIKSAGGRKAGGYKAQMYDRDIEALANKIDQSLIRP